MASNKVVTDHFKITKQTGRTGKEVIGDSFKLPAELSKEDSEIRLLKEFDMDWKYGPCIGLTRLERWQRADKFGLKPPQEVKNLIEKHSSDRLYTECLWDGYTI